MALKKETPLDDSAQVEPPGPTDNEYQAGLTIAATRKAFAFVISLSFDPGG